LHHAREREFGWIDLDILDEGVQSITIVIGDSSLCHQTDVMLKKPTDSPQVVLPRLGKLLKRYAHDSRFSHEYLNHIKRMSWGEIEEDWKSSMTRTVTLTQDKRKEILRTSKYSNTLFLADADDVLAGCTEDEFDYRCLDGEWDHHFLSCMEWKVPQVKIMEVTTMRREALFVDDTLHETENEEYTQRSDMHAGNERRAD
jgi:hypothetical protein